MLSIVLKVTTHTLHNPDFLDHFSSYYFNKKINLWFVFWRVLTYLLRGAKSFFDKTTAYQLVKKFPAFYARGKLTVFTIAHLLSLSWARSIQSSSSSLFLKIHLNIVLPLMSWFSKCSLSLTFLHQNPVCTFPLSILTTWPVHLILLIDRPNHICLDAQIVKLLLM